MKLLRNLFLLPSAVRTAIAYQTLSESSLKSIPFPGSDFNIENGELLAPILIPRVPGTDNSTKVLHHFVDFFQTNLPDWDLTYQNSTSTTPTSNGKEIPFRNLVATRDPPWVADKPGDVGRLVLVAHYDSKLTPEGFIGATDSAAPCAMLMHVARSIDAALTAKWASMAEDMEGSLDVEEHTGVQILLLDGEEAFLSWTHDDSTYGARALAEEWETSFYPATSTYKTPLHSMDLFVLLDLLGSKGPSVPSYFKTTHWAYQRMAATEKKLREAGVFKSAADSTTPFLYEADKKDNDMWFGGRVEDDHLPFLLRGVEILHIIPAPFPAVWHKMEDDGEHLDIATTEDWAVLVTAFAAEWMELEGFLEGPKRPTEGSKGGNQTRRQRDEL
ncbi:hypothetical protein MBLNU230_g2572t1 [Neophaeotheca triangularis]